MAGGGTVAAATTKERPVELHFEMTPEEQELFDMVFEASQRLVEENGGEPVTITWTAPGVDPHEHDDLVAEAFDWLHRDDAD